jgi:hypothetical protein
VGDKESYRALMAAAHAVVAGLFASEKADAMESILGKVAAQIRNKIK